MSIIGGKYNYRVGDMLANAGDRLPVIKTIRSKRSRKSNVLRGLGIILFWVSLLLLIPLFVALFNGENTIPFIATFVITFLLSIYLVSSFGASNVYHHTDGTMMIISLWVSLFLIGMIPYLLSNIFSNPVDLFVNSLFESVSGFTTVGATIFEDQGILPKSLLLWRVITQWIGGIIIVLLFMVILPMFVSGQRSIVKSDLQPSTTDYGIHMKVNDIAKQFILVYVGLTVIFSLLLWLAGILSGTGGSTLLYDSIYLSLSTISIGGFTPRVDIFNDFSDLQKILLSLLMILSATNFFLHFKAIVKSELKVYSEDSEFKTMIIWYAIISVLFIIAIGGGNKTVNAFFILISLATTTGFTPVNLQDFVDGVPVAVAILVLAMMVGGSSGSPAGGIKLNRFIIIMKSIAIEGYKLVNPSVVQVPKLNGEPVDESRIHNAYAVFAIFITAIAVSTLVYTSSGFEIKEAIFTSFSMATATGTCIGTTTASFVGVAIHVKLYTCLLMLFARMEMLSLLAIFMPRFWAEVEYNRRANKDNEELEIINPLDRI